MELSANNDASCWIRDKKKELFVRLNWRKHQYQTEKYKLKLLKFLAAQIVF